MKTLIAALLLGSTLPAAAQTPPPVPPAAGQMQMHAKPGHAGPGHGMRAFGTMSEAGRATMMDAMRGDVAANRADRERVRAARDRMLSVLDAERLDTAALRRAMDDERDGANAMKTRRQVAMAAGFTSLSTADRKAFVEDARSMRDRVERRVEKRLRRGMIRQHKDIQMMAPERGE